MADNHIRDRKSPAFHVRKFILENRERLAGKVVLDLPAGNGAISDVLRKEGCRVEPFDLFPEYFRAKDLKCGRADISRGIPVDDGHADFIVCVEGLEHFSDQIKSLREFNRVLKHGGGLVITTPNYSSLASKLSYLLFESECFNKIMPPNEIDTIWMSAKRTSDELYYGHVFLAGIQKLRFLAKLSGFRIVKVHFVRPGRTSLLLFPLFYPFILLSSILSYRHALKKNRDIPSGSKRKIYGEQLRLNINPKILVDHCLFVEFEKEAELDRLDLESHKLSGNFRPPDKSY